MGFWQVILNFIINEVFGVAAIFIALIALVGLLLQKKSFNEVLTGTIKTAVGYVILQQGVTILVSSIIPLANVIGGMNPSGTKLTDMGSVAFMAQYGSEIGITMLCAFLLNLLIARFTKWKTVFLTGHMLYWFPFVFIAVGVDAGLRGLPLLAAGIITSTAYFVIAPNLARPYVREVVGDDSFTLGHPAIGLVLIGGFLARHFGNKSASTEDIHLPESLGFLKEIAISGSFIIMLAYCVVTPIAALLGVNYLTIYGITSNADLFKFILVSGLTMGAGLTVLMLGVRMVISEIVPAFVGFQEKIVPHAIPAYDCPLLFPYAPNAVILGFIVAMITSIITLVIVTAFHVFQYPVIPIVMTCFFECGTATVVGNALGGRRGAIISAAVSGVLIILFVGLSLPFVKGTIATWMLSSGGQDFSIWGILEGLVLKVFGH